jgi:hypothetical protein
MGFQRNQSISVNLPNNRTTAGIRVIDRLNFFYSPSGKEGYSHRLLLRPMHGLATQVLDELKLFAQPIVRQMLATACYNCGIKYRNPFTGEDKIIESYEELSSAYVQNRDENNFRNYVYAFNNYFKLNREWIRNLEATFMDDSQLQYSTLRSDSAGHMSDIAYYLSHLKHSTISNLQTKHKKSVGAEESLLRGGSLVSKNYI